MRDEVGVDSPMDALEELIKDCYMVLQATLRLEGGDHLLVAHAGINIFRSILVELSGEILHSRDSLRVELRHLHGTT